MPAYLQNAVNTKIGHAHPITGVQLDVTHGLPSPAAFYQPNAREASFIDPAGTATPKQMVMFQLDGLGSLGVDVVLGSRYADLGQVTWTWGDGETTTGGIYERHVYASAGSYTVKADATSASAGDVTASVTFDVGAQAPVVTNPTASFTDSVSGETVTFTDTSTAGSAAISSWAWDFGDSSSSTDQNPAHTYSAAGDYTVKLTVSAADGGTSSASESVTIAAP